MTGDGLADFRTGRWRPDAVLDALSEEARGEAVEIESLATERLDAIGAVVVGEADHALHGGEGLFGEVARGEAALGPGAGLRSDAPGLGEQDGAPVGRADVAYRLEVTGHVFGSCGVLVGSALERVHGDAFTIPGDEDLDHAFSDTDVDGGADMAFGHGVVVATDADVTVGRDLAFDPLAPFPGVPGQGLESGPLAGLEEVAPGRAARHGGVV